MHTRVVVVESSLKAKLTLANTRTHRQKRCMSFECVCCLAYTKSINVDYCVYAAVFVVVVVVVVILLLLLLRNIKKPVFFLIASIKHLVSRHFIYKYMHMYVYRRVYAHV